MLGLVLQRALAITWLACIPITILWAYTPSLLAAARQSPPIVAGASRYLRNITPTLYISTGSECIRKYLLAQRVVHAPMAINALTFALCPLYNWLLIFKLGLGLDGAAYAYVAFCATQAVCLLAYAVHR